VELIVVPVAGCNAPVSLPKRMLKFTLNVQISIMNVHVLSVKTWPH